MWKSRGLCEISKRGWKSFCDFHARAISTAGCRSGVARRPGVGELDRASGRRNRDRIPGWDLATLAIGVDFRVTHRVRSLAAIFVAAGARCGLSRGRYESPSMTRS